MNYNIKKIKHTIVFIYLLLIFSCNQAQNETINHEKQNGMKNDGFTVFDIENIPDIKQGENEKSQEFIKKRLEKLIGKSFKKRCEEIGQTFPPKFVLFRFFKLESEFEIWTGNSPKDELKLLALLPVCAVDNEPGTKFREGDGKTPEGFYTAQFLYGSTNWFMWIKLNTSEIDNSGEVGNGSSFRLCLDYPVSIDKRRTAKYLSPQTSPGGAICIHGNCVTAGCISFKNKNFLPVFLAALYHDEKKFGRISVHSFPFRFTEELKNKYAESADSKMKSKDLKQFWQQLEKGYNKFEKSHHAIRVEFSKDTYIFDELN